jgi:ABC-type uncharacterized transport system involved in gliding motility auxiliary subunit
MSKSSKISYLVSGISLLMLLVARLILGGWIDYLWIPFGISIGTFVFALAVDYKFYFEFLTMKTTKHGMNMGALIGLCLVLTVAVNYLGTRFDKSFDLTREKLNTLSDQTHQALSTLTDPLTILVFYRGNEDKEIRGQLKQNFQIYMDASPKVKIEFIDALLDVDMAKKYLESQKFAVVLDYKGKKAQIEEPYDEEKTASAIFKVTAQEEKTIYFLTGNGERDIDSTEGESLKSFAESLRADGYVVAKLNLLGGDKMPSTGSVIIEAGPKSPLIDAELDKLRQFVREGGHMLIAADPGEHHNLALLTKTFGVEFHNNYIINEFEDLNSLGPLAALGAEYDHTSDITKKFYQGGRVMGSIFMIASEISRASDASTALTIKDIVKTTSKAYVSNQPKPSKDPSYKSVAVGISVSGPVDKIGGAKDDTAKKDDQAKDDKDKKEFAVVIYGDSDFMSNTFFRFGANRDLAMNSVSFLANDLSHISIRPKTPEATPLELTSTKEIMVFMAGVGLPLMLIVLSGFFWYRRRNL